MTIDLCCPGPEDFYSKPSSKPLLDKLNTLSKFELIFDSHYASGLDTDDA